MSSTSENNEKDEAQSDRIRDQQLVYATSSTKRLQKNTSTFKHDEKLQRFEAARKKFEQILPELLKEHKGKFAAVIDDHVEIHEDETQLLEMVIEKYGYKTMYVDRISLEKRVVRMRSPRIVSRL